MICEDCGFEYADGAICPRCGYAATEDLMKAVRVENPVVANRYEGEFMSLCADVDAGKVPQAKAQEYWTVIDNKAREGDRDARHLMCRMALMKGDHAAARKMLARLAEGGHTLAQLDLGKMHEEGLGCEKDVFAAIRLYRQAAAKGNPMALYLLANHHREGGCLKTDGLLATALMEELVAVHPTLFRKRGGCGKGGCHCSDGMSNAEWAKREISRMTRFVKYILWAVIAGLIISIVWSELH